MKIIYYFFIFMLFLSGCIVDDKPLENETAQLINNRADDHLAGAGEGTKFMIQDDGGSSAFNVTDTGNVEIANNITTVTCIYINNGGKIGNCG